MRRVSTCFFADFKIQHTLLGDADLDGEEQVSEAGTAQECGRGSWAIIPHVGLLVLEA